MLEPTSMRRAFCHRSPAGTSGLSSSRAPASRGGSQSGVTAHVRRGQSFLEGAAPLSVEEIRALKDAVFGTCGGDPSDTWKQGFYFSTVPTLGFGLVQSQGGPCGVLAAVQARMLAGMWDRTGRFDLDPSTETREELLVNALSDMVWEARRGATKQALGGWWGRALLFFGAVEKLTPRLATCVSREWPGVPSCPGLLQPAPSL